jgi:hypothetical protein
MLHISMQHFFIEFHQKLFYCSYNNYKAELYSYQHYRQYPV